MALVIGANDVVTPVARTDKNSPICGMPILNADKAQNVSVIKRGEYDYALQADVVKAIEKVSLFGTAGYRWVGSSQEFPLHNVWYGSIGASGKVLADTSVGLAYDYRQAASDGSDAQSEISVFLTQRLGSRFKAQLYGVAGLSDGSPDWGTGLMLSTSW